MLDQVEKLDQLGFELVRYVRMSLAPLGEQRRCRGAQRRPDPRLGVVGGDRRCNRSQRLGRQVIDGVCASGDTVDELLEGLKEAVSLYLGDSERSDGALRVQAGSYRVALAPTAVQPDQARVRPDQTLRPRQGGSVLGRRRPTNIQTAPALIVLS
jgi:hypothetical protein